MANHRFGPDRRSAGRDLGGGECGAEPGWPRTQRRLIITALVGPASPEAEPFGFATIVEEEDSRLGRRPSSANWTMAKHQHRPCGGRFRGAMGRGRQCSAAGTLGPARWFVATTAAVEKTRCNGIPWPCPI